MQASKGTIISLCDLTGVMVLPWLDAGYDAILVDPQHPEGITIDRHVGPAGMVKLTKVGHVVDHDVTWSVLRKAIASGSVVFVAGFPVCTQLAVSGTARWADKRAADSNFQAKAMQLVHECRVIGEMSGAPYFFENPVSAISSIYKKPTHTFHPCDYGGYLPAGEEHPLYPDYFPPQDAYGKKTCLWAGGVRYASEGASPACGWADRRPRAKQGAQQTRRQVRPNQEHPISHSTGIFSGCFRGKRAALAWFVRPEVGSGFAKAGF